MAQMTDVMVDVETTGVDPHFNGIIQLSAIKFNYETEEIGGAFDKCPMLLPQRWWDESTREFWMQKNRAVYTDIVMRQEPAGPVFAAFKEWMHDGEPDKGFRFWAKPTMFDWGFVVSHMNQLGLPMPCHYRYARDLNTFLAALNNSAEHRSVEDQVPFPEGGQEHNALHDCAWQIDQLFFGKRQAVVVEQIDG